MNVNKKLDRFKQWAGEKMGGEARTNLSDDFKSLETEMNMRHEGMDRLQRSTILYIKAISKRNEEDKEKTLPVGHLGSTMVVHGEDFESSSEFGQCLISLGRTQERIARIQESYIASATSSWLESLERSLVQMKEYQAARKKLENRRLAYDTSLAKMQKAKKEDFRVEEELRSQKAKYEETSDDVYRRMFEIKESEDESVADLGAFLDAELAYHDKCREVLLQLRNDWPAGQSQLRPPMNGGGSRRPSRARSNTAHSYHDRYDAVEEEVSPPTPERRQTIRSGRSALKESPSRDSVVDYQRPAFNRTPTFEGPSQLRRDISPAPGRLSRVPTDTGSIRATLEQLRSVNGGNTNSYYGSPDEPSYSNSGSQRPYRERSVSPAASHASALSRTTSSNADGGLPTLSKKGPPPPPPSRAKKPPPPPPPVKRNLVYAVDT